MDNKYVLLKEGLNNQIIKIPSKDDDLIQVYTVKEDGTCDCPAYSFKKTCKHLQYVTQKPKGLGIELARIHSKHIIDRYKTLLDLKYLKHVEQANGKITDVTFSGKLKEDIVFSWVEGDIKFSVVISVKN